MTEGLDYGIIPYRVLSTGPKLGLIQVVPDSETLGRIQHQNGGVFRENGLFSWLEEYSNNNERYIFYTQWAKSPNKRSVGVYF